MKQWYIIQALYGDYSTYLVYDTSEERAIDKTARYVHGKAFNTHTSLRELYKCAGIHTDTTFPAVYAK